MRIVSLVPSATEMLFALGLGADVIAVTHECDYPPAALELPRVTRDVLPSGLSSAQIDAAVKQRTLAGESIYELDVDLIRDLWPDLIVTQALCSVCAVSYEDVRTLAEEIESRPHVISLDPQTVGEVLGDARTLAQATDRTEEAVALVRDTAARIDKIRLAVRGARRPRVVALARWGVPRAGGPAVRTACVWRASSCRGGTRAASAMLCEAPAGTSAAIRVVPDLRWPRSHARPIVCCGSRVASWSFRCSILSPLKALTQQPPPRIVPPLRMISSRP